MSNEELISLENETEEAVVEAEQEVEQEEVVQADPEEERACGAAQAKAEKVINHELHECRDE